jgi:hypothetical protein
MSRRSLRRCYSNTGWTNESTSGSGTWQDRAKVRRYQEFLKNAPTYEEYRFWEPKEVAFNIK